MPCVPSLERVASRAAPGLTVRVASVLYVHVCVLMRVAAKRSTARMAEKGGGGQRETDVRRIAIPHVVQAPAESLCVCVQAHTRRNHDRNKVSAPTGVSALAGSARRHLSVRDTKSHGTKDAHEPAVLKKTSQVSSRSEPIWSPAALSCGCQVISDFTERK